MTHSDFLIFTEGDRCCQGTPIPCHSTPFHTIPHKWGRCSKHSTVFHLSEALWNTSHFYRCYCSIRCSTCIWASLTHSFLEDRNPFQLMRYCNELLPRFFRGFKIASSSCSS